MSSLAGKSAPAFQEPYAATKSALIAFTMSLRETYFGLSQFPNCFTVSSAKARLSAAIRALMSSVIIHSSFLDTDCEEWNQDVRP